MVFHLDYGSNEGNVQGGKKLQTNPDDKGDVKTKVTWILLFNILCSIVERMHQSNSRHSQIIAWYYQSSKLRHIKKDIVDVKDRKHYYLI